jgi:hypothetical protein
MTAKILTADEFLAGNDLVMEFVPTPEIEKNSGVYVRAMSAGAKGRIEGQAAKFKETKGKGDFAETFSILVVVECACNEKGEKLFTRAHVESLKVKNSAVMSRISETGMRLSGFSKADVEALEKNSGTAQHDDSDSD